MVKEETLYPDPENLYNIIMNNVVYSILLREKHQREERERKNIYKIFSNVSKTSNNFLKMIFRYKLTHLTENDHIFKCTSCLQHLRGRSLRAAARCPLRQNRVSVSMCECIYVYVLCNES